MNPMPVYVVSVEGKPLHPTRRYGHVRWLLKHGKAKVVRSRPFQIQLLYKEVELYATPEKKKNRVGGSKAPPLPHHRTCGSRIRRFQCDKS